MAAQCFVKICLVAVLVSAASAASSQGKRCTTPPLAPIKIQKVIGQCQEEIKLAIITEALDVLRDEERAIETDIHEVEKMELKKTRSKREVFTEDEKKIAGCLLQCVYRKVKAVDETGLPTVDGLVKLYTEGVREQGYLSAALDAIKSCLNKSQSRIKNLLKPTKEVTCDVAYDTFECVSDKIGDYCGQKL